MPRGRAPAPGSCQERPDARDSWRQLGWWLLAEVAGLALARPFPAGGGKRRLELAVPAPKPIRPAAVQCSPPRALPSTKLSRLCSFPASTRDPSNGAEMVDQYKSPKGTNPAKSYDSPTLTACERLGPSRP